MFVYVIPDIQSHLDSILESRMSFKTPCLMLWRFIGESPFPVNQAAWNFKESFLKFDICECTSLYMSFMRNAECPPRLLGGRKEKLIHLIDRFGLPIRYCYKWCPGGQLWHFSYISVISSWILRLYTRKFSLNHTCLNPFNPVWTHLAPFDIF